MSENRKNELRKLTAAFFNNIAVGCVLIGLIAPIAQWKFTLLTPRDFVSYEIGIWLLAGAFHMIARMNLWFLED